MTLKRKKKARNRALPLAALGAGIAVAGGLFALLRKRSRGDESHEAAAPAPQADREYDDVTLARKVESEVLGGESALKGQVVVNARDGVVELRGEVGSSDEVATLGAATAKVAGVKGVNNLLHTPGSEPKTSPVSDPDEVRERAERS